MELVEFLFHPLELAILFLVEGRVGEPFGEFRLLGFEFLDLAGKFVEFALFAIEELAALLDFHPFLRWSGGLGRSGDFRGFRHLALAQPVLVAAGVFGKPAFSLVDDRAGHHVVEEGAVVGDKQQRSLVAYEEFLEEFQCLRVEIVGRFIEHQDIGGLQEEASQEEPVALASREHLGRHPDPVGGEEEVPEIAVDVARPSLEGDGLRLSGDIPSHALLPVDLVPELVEVDDLELGSEGDRSGFGLEPAEQKFQQGGLAASVRTDDADLVAAPEGGAEVAHDRGSSVAEADILGLDDLLSGGRPLLEFDLCRAGALATFAPLGAQGLEGADAALVPGAPCLHSLTQPGFLLGELLVECSPLLLLRLQRGTLPFEVGVVIAGPACEVPPVEFDDACGEFPQEGAVVRDEEEGRLDLEQEVLEPEDRFEIEVVGRLVQQEDIGLSHQGAGQQDASLQSSGKTLELFLRRQVHLLHQILHTDIGLPILLGAADAEAGMDHLENRPRDPIRHFLGKPREDDSVRLGDLAFLRFLLAGDDAHDAGLAGSVAPHQTDALARIDLKVDLIEQWSVGVAEGDAAELEKGHGGERMNDEG